MTFSKNIPLWQNKNLNESNMKSKVTSRDGSKNKNEVSFD